MAQLESHSNPFALMLDPHSVLQAIESSDRLARLKSRICRPLDKPLIPHPGNETEVFDEAIDASPDIDV